MKFRIVEKKVNNEEPLFIPQYKVCGIYWRELADVNQYIKSKYCKHTFFKISGEPEWGLKTHKEAYDSIQDYKQYLKDSENREYIRIHNVFD